MITLDRSSISMTYSNEYLALLAVGILFGTVAVVIFVFVYVLGVPLSACWTCVKNRERRTSMQFPPVLPTEVHMYEEGYAKENSRIVPPSAPPISLLDSDTGIYTNAPMVCVASPSQSPGSYADSTLRYNDTWAAVAFLLHVVVILFFALKAVIISAHEVGEPVRAPLLRFALSIAAMFVLSVVIGGIWLDIVTRHASTIIQTMLWCCVIGYALVAVCLLAMGSVLLSTLVALLAVLSYSYMDSVQDRVHFASVVLATACSSLRKHTWSIAGVAIGVAVLQLVWFWVWFLGLVGLEITVRTMRGHTHTHNDSGDVSDSSLPGGVLFLLALSLLWGWQVLSYILHVTVGGSMALWWFRPHHPSVVTSALFRTCSYHFGSVCMGALLVALLRTVHAVVDAMRQAARRRGERGGGRGEDNGQCAREVLLCVLELLVGCVEQAVRCVNKYALCFVAAYGDNFVTAGKAAVDLFTDRYCTVTPGCD